MANRSFKAKLTITQDDIKTKCHELSIKNESIDGYIELIEKRQLEWNSFRDELNSHDYDGLFGVPPDDCIPAEHKKLFSEARLDIFYNVKDLLNNPLDPYDIKMCIDMHEQLQTLSPSNEILGETYGIPSNVKDGNLFVRDFKFLYQLWCDVQKGPQFCSKKYRPREKKIDELLRAGGRSGAKSNKNKADVRAKGLKEAAKYKFKENPVLDYDECVAWIISQDQLRKFLIYGNKGKILSVGRIKQIITGTKREALEVLKNISS
jgi:hypothetical protein